MDAAAAELDALVALFGPDNVAVELTRSGDPLDGDRNDALVTLAEAFGLPTVATGNVHYATPARRRLATALAAVRARRSLDEIDGWLPGAGTATCAPVRRWRRCSRDYPGAVAQAAAYGEELAFDLQLVTPQLPAFQVGDGPLGDELAAQAHDGGRGATLRATRAQRGRRTSRSRTN